jgi:hypothetical protein
MASLFGTHKHVQEFSPDDDDYEYEEEVVTLFETSRSIEGTDRLR